MILLLKNYTWKRDYKIDTHLMFAPGQMLKCIFKKILGLRLWVLFSYRQLRPYKTSRLKFLEFENISRSCT